MRSDHSCFKVPRPETHRSHFQTLILLHWKRAIPFKLSQNLNVCLFLLLYLSNTCLTSIFILNSFNVLVTNLFVRKCATWVPLDGGHGTVSHWAHSEPLPQKVTSTVFLFTCACGCLCVHTHSRYKTWWTRLVFMEVKEVFSLERSSLKMKKQTWLSVGWGDASHVGSC